MARDFKYCHTSVKMDGDKPCATCKFAVNMGYCTFHKTGVSVFDGCKNHEEK